MSEDETLPILEYADSILDTLAKSSVFICLGETGSGKTTQIPQICLFSKNSPYKTMAVTQPRRVAAISVAQRVCDEQNVQMGNSIGYSVRFDDTTSSKTRLRFMTDGILVRECLLDRYLSSYDIVMIDEAHERSIHTDILFGLIKQAIQARPSLKVIISSATLDATKFSNYFYDCPVLSIPGRVFHVDIYHSALKQIMTSTGPASTTAYVNNAVELVGQIHQREEKGHILLFLTGQEEIESACSKIRYQLEQHLNDATVHWQHNYELKVLPLYATLPLEAQKSVFLNYSSERRYVRKCVVCTNIAETSITVPGVKYVIDCGYVKQKTYDPSRRMESLLIVPISKVSAQQRAGRAGRTGPGECYRLYSSTCYDNMIYETIPEIQRSSMNSVVLYLKTLGIHNVIDFDYFERPSIDQLVEGLMTLYYLGALNSSGEVTDIGKKMANFPLEPFLARMIIEAARDDLSAVPYLVIIAAMVSVENIYMTKRIVKQTSKRMAVNNASSITIKANTHFANHLHSSRSNGNLSEYSRESEDDSEYFNNCMEHAHSKFRDRRGDYWTFLWLYLEWDHQGQSTRWCEEHYINYRAMKMSKNIKEQLENDCRKIGYKLTGYGHRDDKRVDISRVMDLKYESNIGKAIASALYMNTARRCGTGGASGAATLFRSIDMIQGKREAFTSNVITINTANNSSNPMEIEILILHIHPSSSMIHGHPSEYIVYQDLVHSSKLYMKHVNHVDYAWVEYYGNHMNTNISYHMLTGLQVPEPVAVLNTQKLIDEVPDSNETRNAVSTAVKRSADAAALNDTISAAKLRFLARKK